MWQCYAEHGGRPFWVWGRYNCRRVGAMSSNQRITSRTRTPQQNLRVGRERAARAAGVVRAMEL